MRARARARWVGKNQESEVRERESQRDRMRVRARARWVGEKQESLWVCLKGQIYTQQLYAKFKLYNNWIPITNLGLRKDAWFSSDSKWNLWITQIARNHFTFQPFVSFCTLQVIMECVITSSGTAPYRLGSHVGCGSDAVLCSIVAAACGVGFLDIRSIQPRLPVPRELWKYTFLGDHREENPILNPLF